MDQLYLSAFIAYLEDQVKNHSIYVWSAQGEGYNVISDAWIKKMETSDVNAQRAINFWHKQVAAGYGKVLKAFDCSGLGMSWLEKNMKTPDLTAQGMYSTLCDPIKKNQLKRGDWVFKKNSSGSISHIGYIVDKELNVIEAKGRDDGVVKRPIKATTWSVYGRPKMFTRDINGGGDDWVVTRVLREGQKGDDVQEMKRRLTEKGFSKNMSYKDNTFGKATKENVIAYQKSLWPNDPKEWDGIAGRKTLTALGAVCVW